MKKNIGVLTPETVLDDGWTVGDIIMYSLMYHGYSKRALFTIQFYLEIAIDHEIAFEKIEELIADYSMSQS